MMTVSSKVPPTAMMLPLIRSYMIIFNNSFHNELDKNLAVYIASNSKKIKPSFLISTDLYHLIFSSSFKKRIIDGIFLFK